MTNRPFAWALLSLVAVLAVGTVGYMAIEGWTSLDAFWMVVITLTTIGYGEVHPLSPSGRLFTIGLIVAGLSVGTWTMTRLTWLILEGELPEMMRRRRRKRVLDHLDRHYIVVGYGRLGEAVAQELRGGGVGVCVIEKDAPHCARIEADGFAVVQGDGSDDDVLRAAGIERAKGLAVAVSSGAEAVFVTLSARQLRPDLPIVTRVTDAEHAVKARRAGATSVVSPHTMGGWRMAHGLVRPHATTFLDLATLAGHEEILLEEYEVPADSPIVGRTLGDLKVGERFGVLVVAIRRSDGRMVPTPRAGETLTAGDVLITIGQPGPVREMRRMALGQKPPNVST